MPVQPKTTQKRFYEEENYSSEVETIEGPPPKILKAVPSCILRPEDIVTLSVKIDASPPARFKWFYEDVELTESETVFITEGYNQSSVTIKHPKPGSYKVKATNKYGTATSVAYITVRGMGTV